MTIKQKISANKSVLTNFSYLSILQILYIVFPLITYPYTLRIIGLELNGVVIFAQAIVAYISIIISFGFNITGVRDIAENKNDDKKISEIISSIYSVRFIIWLTCLVIYLLVITHIQLSSDFIIVYFFAFFISLNELLFPVWYFQGIEKMEFITIINVGVRLLFVVSIFVFVNNASDYILIPILNAMSSLISGLIAIYIVFIKHKRHFKFIDIQTLTIYFKQSTPVFLSILSTHFYMNLNKLIVGSYLGMSEITIYDMGEKVASILKIPYSLISQSVFPRVSREKNRHYINNVLKLSLLLSIIAYMILFVFSENVVIFLAGKQIKEASLIVRILSASSMFVSVSTFLGGCRLIPLGYQKVHLLAMLECCIFYVFSLVIIIFTENISLISLSILSVLVEVFCMFVLFYFVKKNNLF